MIPSAMKFYNKLIINTLYDTKGINKWRRDFFIEVLWLYLGIKDRINYLQFARYGLFGEQRYRQQSKIPFNFLDFNSSLVKGVGSGKYAIGFDPSYISKSGKKTPGVGYFWSGCSSKALWGLEIGGIAAIDLDNKTAFHLEACQNSTILNILRKYQFFDKKISIKSISGNYIFEMLFCTLIICKKL